MNDNYTYAETKKSIDLPEPNPKTKRLHREEYRRQILLPALLGLFILVGLIIGIWMAGIGSPERWASISTIFLLLPLLLIGLVVLALLVFFILMMGELMGMLPRYTRLAQGALEKIKEQAEIGANLTVQPVIQLRGYLAMIERLFGRSKKS